MGGASDGHSLEQDGTSSSGDIHGSSAGEIPGVRGDCVVSGGGREERGKREEGMKMMVYI